MIYVTAIRIFQSDGTTPYTGLDPSKIQLRVTPFGSGNAIVCTPVELSHGWYSISGLDVLALVAVKLYVDSGSGFAEQTTWGYNGVGNSNLNFVHLTGNETINGSKTLNGATVQAGNSTHTAQQTFTTKSPLLGASSAEYTGNAPAFSNSLIWSNYLNSQLVLREPASGTNLLIVDSDATADGAKIFNTIADAVTYAATRSSSSQWNIQINGNKTGYYEWNNITLYDFIHIIGNGKVVIRNPQVAGVWSTVLMFTRQSSPATKIRLRNLNFEQTDSAANLDFKDMICENCTVTMADDSFAPNLVLDSSTFKNCYFSLTGTGTFTSNDNNLFVDCTCSKDITLQTNDHESGLKILGGIYWVNN